MKNSFAVVLVLMAALSLPLKVNAQIKCETLNGAYVYSAEDNPVYLGFFGKATHPESIMNFSGPYGSSSGSYSVRNPKGKYGSSNGEFSANNPTDWYQSPPLIYKNGAYVSLLSATNPEEDDSVQRISLSQIDSTCSSFASNTPPFRLPADLAITSLEAQDGVYFSDDAIPVITKIENIGEKDSAPYRITFYASEDTNITVNDAYWYWDMGVLAAGESHFIKFEPKLPSVVPAGQYYIGAIVTVDDDGDLRNNSRYDSTPIVVRSSSPSPSFEINSGLNDTWYDPATSGQGFYLAVLPELGLVSLAWFTFDTDTTASQSGVSANLGSANHRWLTALGAIDGNQVVMKVYNTSGGVFDTSSQVKESQVGTIKLIFDDCYSGAVEYDIWSVKRQGTIPIQRVANDNVALCEALRESQVNR